MGISAINSTVSPDTSGLRALERPRGGFAEKLQRALGTVETSQPVRAAEKPGIVGTFALAAHAVEQPEEVEQDKRARQVRQSAEQLIATTFIMPLFKRLRNDPLATKLFHGGQGEDIFQQQMDQILADRMAASANFDLVDSVEQFFTGRIGGEALKTKEPVLG